MGWSGMVAVDMEKSGHIPDGTQRRANGVCQGVCEQSGEK